jgi:hypothetical protein
MAGPRIGGVIATRRREMKRLIGRIGVPLVLAVVVLAGPATVREAAAAGPQGQGAVVALFHNRPGTPAVDADLVVGRERLALARLLKPGEDADFLAVKAGRVKLEVRLAELGRPRALYHTIWLRAGRAYCVRLDPLGEVALRDVTRAHRIDPKPERLCRPLAPAADAGE